MSSISFPNSSQSHPSSSNSPLDGPFYSSSFEAMSSNGFQMNPHSPHPPRTPRTSVMSSNNTVYNPEIFTSEAEMEERPTDLEEEVDVDIDSVKANARARGQGIAPIYPADGTSKSKEPTSRPLLHTFLHASPPVLLELVNAFADDVSTFSRLGLLGKRTGDRAGRLADWCWFASTLVDLVENGVERSIILNSQREVESRLFADSMTGATAKSTPRNTRIDETELHRLQRQDYWLQITRAKLVMDLAFVSYDVFKLQRGKSAVKTFAGLASAALSSAKLYDRHRNVLVKALTF
ncbi:hypothetical protein EW146_g8953 [Bondarzewia mesenterica]|uniref:Uncharacterized protein n=1 Tax=Bondarzewia mesenterica TaxID=1095465 RepID=A0A4S4LC25_9AGAM|nr:hypothetical protein EW146_g8953 [Bondarzewia mesenterica]